MTIRNTNLIKWCPRCNKRPGVVLDTGDGRFCVIWLGEAPGIVDIDEGIPVDLLTDPNRGCGYCNPKDAK